MVGTAFALALAQANIAVALVAPHSPPALPFPESWDNRVYALSPGNVSWLRELGAGDAVAGPRAARVESMRIFGDQPPASLQFSAYDSGLSELAWIVENNRLQLELWNALGRAAHVSVFSPARCAAIDWARDHAALTLGDGQTLAGRLIVGADGADSWVREQAGISCRSHAYAQTGVVANFACGRSHDGIAFQWFRADGVLALLPLPGDRVSMVWSASPERARQLLRASSDVLVSGVEEASGLLLGKLDLITAPVGFPLRRQRVDRLVEPRVALIGDAAHNVHPLAGQGVNLGFRDARELAAVLVGRGARSDCGDYGLLRRYERARKEDIAALELTTDGLEKLFASRAVWVAGLRNRGLALVDSQLPLKNMLVRHAVA